MNDASRSASSRAKDQRPAEAAGTAVFVICLVQLMVVLDVTVVNVALPSVRADLAASLAESQWVVTAYALAFGGLLLLGGRAGDVYGRRRVFLTGIGIFTLASLVAGLASEPWQLIAARALQGVGAAAASPTALALIATTIPDRRLRGRALGMYAAMSGLGAALGLVLGGTTTQWLSWRWTFLINVPVGVLAIVLALGAVRETPVLRMRLDLGGTVAGTTGVGALVYGCSVVAEHGGPRPSALLAFLAAGVLLMLFVWLQVTRQHALMPLGVLRHPDRGTAFASMLTVGACLFSLLYFASRLLQVEMGFGPLRAGVAFLPFSVAMVAMSQAAARRAHGAHAWRWVTGGLLVTGAALAWFASAAPDDRYVTGVLGPLLAAGLGLGAAFVPLTLLAIADIDPERAGIASGVLDSMQQLGGAIGIAVLASVAARPPAEGRRALAQAAGQFDHASAFALACGIVVVTAVLTTRRAVAARRA